MAMKLDSVCLALVALWDAAVALDGVTVYDGPQVNSDPVPEALFVGHDGGLPDEDTEGAVTVQSLMAFLKTKQEDGEITCAAVVVRGDTDIATARARAVAIVSAAEDALRVDMQLAGLVMHAFVSEQRFIPMQTDKGAKARVVFTVTYLAQL
jgi:hypothetical protein